QSAMEVTTAQFTYFVILYLLLLAAVVRPQMNFSVYVEIFYLRSHYSAFMILGYRFDTIMAVVAAPLSAATVYAVSQWKEVEAHENPVNQKMIITAVVSLYVIVLVSNVVVNKVALQQALIHFGQCPRKAWHMYGQMAASVLQSWGAGIEAAITKKRMKKPRLVYRLH
ncbi:hypothetical protein KR074_007399, partial [Drosophila pseudoananassae]